MFSQQIKPLQSLLLPHAAYRPSTTAQDDSDYSLSCRSPRHVLTRPPSTPHPPHRFKETLMHYHRRVSQCARGRRIIPIPGLTDWADTDGRQHLRFFASFRRTLHGFLYGELGSHFKCCSLQKLEHSAANRYVIVVQVDPAEEEEEEDTLLRLWDELEEEVWREVVGYCAFEGRRDWNVSVRFWPFDRDAALTALREGEVARMNALAAALEGALGWRAAWEAEEAQEAQEPAARQVEETEAEMAFFDWEKWERDAGRL